VALSRPLPTPNGHNESLLGTRWESWHDARMSDSPPIPVEPEPEPDEDDELDDDGDRTA